MRNGDNDALPNIKDKDNIFGLDNICENNIITTEDNDNYNNKELNIVNYEIEKENELINTSQSYDDIHFENLNSTFVQ